jgi:hypothetical protein
MLGREPPGVLQLFGEWSATVTAHSWVVRKVQVDRLHAHRQTPHRPGRHSLVLIRGGGAGHIENRSARPHLLDRAAQQPALNAAYVRPELLTVRPRGFSTTGIALARARSVHERAVEKHSLGKRAAVAVDDHHARMTEPVEVADERADPLLVHVVRDHRAGPTLQLGDVRHLSARRRAEVQDALAGQRSERERRDSGCRLLQIEEAEPVLEREGDGEGLMRGAEEAGEARDRLQSEAGGFESAAERVGSDARRVRAQRDGRLAQPSWLTQPRRPPGVTT